MQSLTSLLGIDEKLKRAKSHISNLNMEISRFCASNPYTVRIQEDTDEATGDIVGRLISERNREVPAADPQWILIASETIYHLRSALDHLIYQLVILNGQEKKIINSRKHQFPIFDKKEDYDKISSRMIDGISLAASDLIKSEQPYARSPHAPRSDFLWILQDLNNTDKHRVIPVSVIGIGGVTGSDDVGATLFRLISPDIQLEDGKVFWTFRTPARRYDNINAEISSSVAFEQAMSTVPGGPTTSLHIVLWHVYYRVDSLINLFRQMFM